VISALTRELPTLNSQSEISSWMFNHEQWCAGVPWMVSLLTPQWLILWSMSRFQYYRRHVWNVMFGTHERELNVVVISSLQHRFPGLDDHKWVLQQRGCKRWWYM
jgi:hypothetical protein